jgi:hypothetical protein
VEPPGSNEDQFEHIPWERLQPQRAITTRHLYLIGGAVVVGALAFAATRGIGTPASTTTAVSQSEPAVTVPPTIPGAELPSPMPSVVAEADLMAVEPGILGQAAAMQAEWFVEEYFTVDGSPRSAAALARFLPPGSAMPGQEKGRSFVESARAVSIEDQGAGRFRVVVVVRRLAAPDGGAYSRLAPGAVEVVVDYSTGVPSILDLPTPVPLPEVAVPGPHETAEVPADVAAKALEGRPPGTAVISGGPEGSGWRLVLSIPDESGLTWPMAVRIEA